MGSADVEDHGDAAWGKVCLGIMLHLGRGGGAPHVPPIDRVFSWRPRILDRRWRATAEGAHMQRMNEIPNLVASTALTGSLDWNATAIEDVPRTARLRGRHLNYVRTNQADR